MPGTDDSDYDRDVEIGNDRLRNEETLCASLYIPAPPAWSDDRIEFVKQQVSCLGGTEKTLMHYSELLVRSQALVDFFTHNVGETEEWPLSICGESPDAERHLGRLVDKLRVLVGLLTESA
jgi:hypothetical protein